MAGVLGMMNVLARFGGEGIGRGGPPLWMMPIMAVFGVILVVLFVLFVFWLVRYFYRTEIFPGKPVPETPLGIAQLRYAAGEISAEEFDNIKQRL